MTGAPLALALSAEGRAGGLWVEPRPTAPLLRLKLSVMGTSMAVARGGFHFERHSQEQKRRVEGEAAPK